ncbi:ABC transporter permease [Ruania zhangjianzhongii]|uniref:ABC transporter permease n=1 Tax=Ruania zhangjianzhongii TaxID=2603206 RepID=UPI0011C72323|nr:ABC transporter permease [Ruania zhangjianzhongii]
MRTRKGQNVRLYALSIVAVIAVLGGWELAASGMDPSVLPGPITVIQSAWQLLLDGSLVENIGISVQRVLLGWLLGCAIAIPVGILAGASKYVRAAIDPFIHFFRFVPAIALTSLFMLWFGIGEESKVNLIAWACAFVVVVSTAAGGASVPTDKIDAARCFGANRAQVLAQVVIPSAMPSIFTGMRLALANAFLVVVAAEALAARSGIGFLVWNARTYFRTDHIFVGVLCFGILGFLADRIWKLVGSTVLQRYLRGSGDY